MESYALLDALLNQYRIVFDDNGNARACGRDNCKQLIRLCEDITHNAIDFGNAETGYMNAQAIHTLVSELCK